VVCRMPAIYDSTGQAITGMSDPSCASVDGLTSTAFFGHDTQLYGVSTAFEQVPVRYRLKDPYGGTLANLQVSRVILCIAWAAVPGLQSTFFWST